MAANEKESFKVSGQWGEEELTVGTVYKCVYAVCVHLDVFGGSGRVLDVSRASGCIRV